MADYLSVASPKMAQPEVTSEPDRPFSQFAVWHAERVLAICGIATMVFSFLVVAATYLSADSDLFPLIGFPMLLGISVFASWASIWAVFGVGSWLRRFLMPFTLAHLFFTASVFITSVIEHVVDNGDDATWQVLLAMIAGFSYAMFGQILSSMLFLWVVKLFRFRLLYFDDPERYVHPRSENAKLPIDARERSVALHRPQRLIDVFGYTTLIAGYMALWVPLDRWLESSSMFGPSFLLVIVLFFLLANAAVGWFVVLVPSVVAMLDRQGARTQWVFHILYGLFTAVVTWIVLRLTDNFPESYPAFGIGIVYYILHLCFLAWTMHRPKRCFRFRLLKAPRVS